MQAYLFLIKCTQLGFTCTNCSDAADRSKQELKVCVGLGLCYIFHSRKGKHSKTERFIFFCLFAGRITDGCLYSKISFMRQVMLLNNC